MKSTIRSNKTCQNCGAFVEKSYCPQCGQENTDSRQHFYHLFTHFFSDFIHYDGSFWTTARYLLFRPGKLSIEYMDGKRKSYVNPFSLYIFISFVTFFIPSILSLGEAKQGNHKKEMQISLLFNDSTKVNASFVHDTIRFDTIQIKKYTIAKYGFSGRKVSQLDSLYHAQPDSTRMSDLEYNEHKLAIIFNTLNNDGGQNFMDEKIIDFYVHNLPKVLIFYMPIFALLLWLFNCRKQRSYFDSGIFTLHFFSFWLLLISCLYIINKILPKYDYDEIVYLILYPGMVVWTSIYFLKAMRRFYDDSKFVTFVKGTLLIWINTLCLSVVMTLYTLYVVIHFIPVE